MEMWPLHYLLSLCDRRVETLRAEWQKGRRETRGNEKVSTCQPSDGSEESHFFSISALERRNKYVDCGLGQMGRIRRNQSVTINNNKSLVARQPALDFKLPSDVDTIERK